MVLLNVLWSPVNLAFSVALNEWSAAAVGLVRWGGFALIIWCLLGQKWFRARVNAHIPRGKDAVRALAIGAFLFAPGHLCYILAQKYTSTFEATVLGMSGPIWVAMLAFFLLGEEVTSKRWLAIAVGLLGAYIVVAGFALPQLEASHTVGNLLYLLGVLLESVGMVAAMRIVLRTSGIGTLAWQAAGMGVAFFMMPLFGSAGAIVFGGFSVATLIAVGYLMLIASLVCFTVWYVIAEKVPVSWLVITVGLQVPLSACLGVAFNNEKIGVQLAIGTLVILIAIVLASMDRVERVAPKGAEEI